jgi:transcription initiation factor TFIIB
VRREPDGTSDGRETGAGHGDEVVSGQVAAHGATSAESYPPVRDMAEVDDETSPPRKCPNCGKGPFVRDEESGELVCSNCGYVLREKEENDAPSFYDDGGGRPQIMSGPPTSIAKPDMGLSTVIGRTDTDAAGGAIRGRARSTLDRMRVWDRRSQPKVSGYASMGRAFQEIRTLAEKLSLGEDVIEQAAYIYRKAIERKLSRGRPTVDLAAASLYAACRELQIPRSLKDVALAGSIEKGALSRAYRVILDKLDIKMPVEDPIRSLAKIGSAVDASPATMKRAYDIMRRAAPLELSAGKDPMAQGGAALYLASQQEGGKDGRTQKEIAAAAEVTELTLRNRYKTLKAGLKV